MKIQLVSDLHMEFAPIEIVNAGADILVLSGDIITADPFTRSEASPLRAKATEWRTWFEAVCAQFARVYYVLGNHEHYKGNFYETALVLRENLGHIHNLIILDNAYDCYEGFCFVGGTLWTDFDHDNFKAMLVRDGLNDYKLIQGKNYRKLTPAETALDHDRMLGMIAHCADTFQKLIVLGHHAPSWNSITPEYKNGVYAHLNPGYASHHDAFIASHSNIKLWTHGHVHSSHDYMIGETRVVANPRGYARKSGENENSAFDPNLVLNVH